MTHDAEADDSADQVIDTAEWIRRCRARLSELDPVLLHRELSTISEDMSRRRHWRRMLPEAAAQDALFPPATRQPRNDEGGFQLTSEPTP